MKVVETSAEIGGGLNGRRKKLMRILSRPEIGALVVEHRDRPARFGSEYIEAALAASGRRILVVDTEERKDDLVSRYD